MDGARFLQVSELRRYWDEIARGGSASPGDLDPELARVIRQVHATRDVPPPDPLYASRLRDALMQATTVPVLPAAPLTGPESNGRSTPPVRRPILSALPGAPRRWALAQLATALLVVLVLVGSVFAFGPGRLGQEPHDPAIIPAISGTPATPETATPVAEFQWEVRGTSDHTFRELGRPAIDPEGNLWVPDASSHQFFIFAQDGTFLETWGSRGSGEGEFDLNCETYPHGGVVFDASGAFYVLDAGNARVQKFGREREFLTSWGNQGDADDQFVCPSGIALDRQGRVYVSDWSQDKVSVFDGSGAWLATWPTPRTPGGIAADGDGNIWVANFENGSVVKFSPNGDRLATWVDSAERSINGPVHVAIDAEDRVFVTEHDRDRVQIFTPDGTPLGAWGKYGEAPGELREPRGIALDGEGGVYVTEWLGNRVQKFRLLPPLAAATTPALTEMPATPESETAPVVEFLWEADGEPAAPLILPAGAAVDPRGNLWVTDGFNGWFTIFSPEGDVLETWGIRGHGEGEFEFQCRGEGYGGVAFDAVGNIYVADAGNDRIQKFGPDRDFLTSWRSEGIADSQLLVTGRGNRGAARSPLCPVAIAIDGQGRVIVNNQDARTIEVFAPDGRPLATVTDKRMRPEGLALDGNGQMWVADVSGRVLTFSETGNLLATWDNTGSGTGELDTPMGIAVDGDGRVYVSDSGDRVQVFAPDGAFLGAWGSPGTEAGQFSGPVSLTLDGNGHIYVVEHSGSRVQKFRLLPPSGAG